MNLTEDEQNELLDIIKEFNTKKKDYYKIVYIEKVYWTNLITKTKQTVNDLFFLGTANSSSRPKCILTIEYKGKKYKIHEFLSHQNLNSSVEDEKFTLNGEDLYIYYQDFCNPMTSHQVYAKKGAENILKGQLLGQNGDSPYQTVKSVTNDGFDYPIRRTDGKALTNKASIAELLLRKSPEELQRGTDIGNIAVAIPNTEDEIAIKRKVNEEYTIINKSQLETYKEEISQYYPIITYEETKSMFDNIPKQDIDMTVVGLGSAGTGILDQVCRSTYCNNYLLIDFDLVEHKNLRNQWYLRSANGCRKVESSRNMIKAINQRASIITKDTRFENIPLNLYKSKYVVSGFDNLECRMRLLDKCISSFETKYLIDIRYLDYTSSIYFIDMEDEKQVKYYRNLLQADIDAFNENKEYIQTKEELIKYWKDNGLFESGCRRERNRIFGCGTSCHVSCRSTSCLNKLWDDFLNTRPLIEKSGTKEESSCVKENFIDIYKYSSSFIFSAIREIENGNEKPFTHIEAQTEVIPSSIVVRK